MITKLNTADKIKYQELKKKISEGYSVWSADGETLFDTTTGDMLADLIYLETEYTLKRTDTKVAELTSIKIEVSINCTEFLGTDIDIMSEFGKLGDEVTYYTDVTVTKTIEDSDPVSIISREIEKLKRDMKQMRANLLERL